MDTFVDSSWYFLRYLSPDLEEAPFDANLANEWLPVDAYVGGEEHAVLHLLYIRFFARALADLELLEHREPVQRLINQGTVLHGGEKMSKTGGNVVAPHEYGPETTRLFVLSAAHPEQDFEWTAKDVSTAYDLQQQVHGLAQDFVERDAVREERRSHDEYVAREVDRTVLAAAEDYDRFRFHQAVTEVRRLADLLGQYRAYDTPHEAVYRRGLLVLARLIAPITPYLGEEVWNMLRGGGLAVEADWPAVEHEVESFAAERDLVGTLRADVRDIVDVAGLEDPEHIEVALAPEWKYRAHRLAREADPDAAVVGLLMNDEAVGRHGEAAQTYAEDLQERARELEPALDADTEREVLERAAWLLDDEFGADVTVRRAEDGEMARKAEPGKPAIHIS
jgi:leucyl-tRNA synthetase